MIVAGVGTLLVAATLFLPPAATADGARIEKAALVPPILAIVLALVTRRLLLALFGAVLVGSLIRFGWVRGLPAGASAYVLEGAFDTWHLYIIGFTLALLGMVQLTARSGGARGVVEWGARFVASARSTRIGTAVLGLCVFFDDYANCLLVGPSMRPLSDRYGVSREKLAYLIDSTAAPVAGLVILSTWVGYEAGLLGEVGKSLGLSQTGYALLLAALPFRFYCVTTLGFVFLSAALGRDYGPMLAAERRAFHQCKPLRDGAVPLGDVEARHAEPPDGAPHRAINAVLPVTVVVACALGGFVVDGGGGPRLAERPGAALSFAFWRETLGTSENNVVVLFWSALAGLVTASVLPLAQRILGAKDAILTVARGLRRGLYAVGVLVLAWALAAVCKDLGTGTLLVALLGPAFPPAMVPAFVFLAGAAVAFATGTSWGTMAILIPTAVPLAHALGGESLMFIAMAAVLDGAIFGDHCSPISDTTLMSSIGAGCDHLDHVTTQAPYALTCMSIALVAGYLPAALGASAAVTYAAAAGTALLVLLVFGRRVEASSAK